MALDALAARLEELLSVGSLPSSRLSTGMRVRLDTLFKIGALRMEKSGAGRRAKLVDRAAVDRWIGSQYPSGLDGTDEDLPPRAESVANFRDSKRGRRIDFCLTYMRGFRGTVLRRGDASMPLADLTRDFGVAGVVVEPSRPWVVEGLLGIVENLELFLHVESVLPDLDAAVWAAGRFDQRVLDWLAAQQNLSVLHIGDYDPVGLDEYLRVKRAFGDRADLHIPEDLRERSAKYGQSEILVRSVAVYKRVRVEADDRVLRVLAALDQRCRGFEQEGLVINGAARVPPGEEGPAG